MAYGMDDRAREQISGASGTGPWTLPVSAVPGFQTFLAAWGASGSGEACLTIGSQWQTGYFSINAGGTQLTLVEAYDGSSGNGVAVTFSAGTMDVFGDVPAELAHHLNMREIAVASAATCDIGAVRGTRIEISGTTTITSFGTSKNRWRLVRFSGATLLTHNATSLILPGGANIPTIAGDTAVFASDASGNWRCFAYGMAARRKLTAARTYYVRTDGSDSNTGLIDSASGAFLTISKALSVVAGLDIDTFDVTIQVRDGTYNGNAMITGAWLGSGTVTLLGNTGTPANVIINGAITVQSSARLTISGMELRSGSNALMVLTNSAVIIGSAVRFGTTTGIQIYVESGGLVSFSANASITGNAGYHIYLDLGGILVCTNKTITLTGTPAFAGAFLNAAAGSICNIFLNTYSGSATGTRYGVATNSVVNTAGGGASYLPGNAAGSASSGGQYV